ncbi:MAG: MMPL family transporter, partial [Algiphilus sp.]
RLLDIPFNSETVVISSLAIGIGVDYSVHIGERFLAQERLAASLAERMETVLTGTGGALLGSTATTVGGFGVLALAISPPLQRFGIVTALAILLTFIATMLVLPALLVLRERWIDRKRA